MKRMLTAQNAEIHTAAVSIRTLTVEGKQVTMGVFRQLIEEDIIIWKTPVSLKGVGWGHVRYLIDCEPDVGINLVWQKGNELRRCIVYRSANDWRCEYKSGRTYWDTRSMYDSVSKKSFVTHHGYLSAGYSSPFIDIPNLDGFGPVEFKTDDPDTWKLSSEQKEELYKPRYKPYEDKFEADFFAFCNRVNTACAQYEALVGPLFDLPHLFIAV